MNIRRGIVLIVTLSLGVAIRVLGTWPLGLSHGRQVQVLEAVAWVNEDGMAIGLSPDGDAPGTSYSVAGAMWREPSSPWQVTFPTCLQPLGSDQRVRIDSR